MANLFPVIPGDIPVQAATSIGRVPAFDSGASSFLLRDGALVERSGTEAVKQWFALALRQQPDRVPIYQMEGQRRFGIDRKLISGKLPDGLVTAELERNVRETASFCPAVREIRNLTVTRQHRACHIEFTAVLYDDTSVEVMTDV